MSAPRLLHPLVDSRRDDPLPDVAVVGAIGDTPLLPLRSLARSMGLPERIELWLKCEWTNPGGSIKDRPALGIVRAAFASGDLGGGKVLLDATSGNTGIAYAMLGAALGFQVELVVPGSASEERKRLLAAYGATVTYSDSYDGSNGAIRLASEMALNGVERYFYADQYSNPANPSAHAASTGPEIWRQTRGALTHFVAGLGTSGTMMGTGGYLKERDSTIQLVGVQPSEAFHGIEGIKHLASELVPAIYDSSVTDCQVNIESEKAFEMVRWLARKEGLFVGISTGAALVAALRVGTELAEREQCGRIVVIAPDGGGKYLSGGAWH
ncbi:MAG: cysteine synthase family protein [Chloroflexota bacterium]|nr:cysteine synthase family protein [Chloroflexota bacterium]